MDRVRPLFQCTNQGNTYKPIFHPCPRLFFLYTPLRATTTHPIVLSGQLPITTRILGHPDPIPKYAQRLIQQFSSITQHDPEHKSSIPPLTTCPAN